MFVYRIIHRFSQTSTVDDRKRNAPPRVVGTNSAIKLFANACAAILVKTIDPINVTRLIRDDLHMKAYRRSTGQWRQCARSKVYNK